MQIFVLIVTFDSKSLFEREFTGKLFIISITN